MVSKQINEMLKYTSEKFLNLKINTNASLLNEEKNTLILSSNVKTLVFSPMWQTLSYIKTKSEFVV